MVSTGMIGIPVARRASCQLEKRQEILIANTNMALAA